MCTATIFQRLKDAVEVALEQRKAGEAARDDAQYWVNEAEFARTQVEAESYADNAEECSKLAGEAVGECRKAVARASRARTELRKAGAGGLDADRIIEIGREALVAAKGAAEAAAEAAEQARVEAEATCLTCDERHCACREIMCAILARTGSGHMLAIDAEAVRIGELIMSGDDDLRTAGQMLLCDEWEEAEEVLARAGETPTEVAERQGALRTAEATAAEESAERRRRETYDGRTAADWARVAGTHAERAAAAYEAAGEVWDDVRGRHGHWLPLYVVGTVPADVAEQRAADVPAWVDVVAEAVRDAYRRTDRRSTTAHDIACLAGAELCEDRRRHGFGDGRRAYELSERARVLADACEADAHTAAEALRPHAEAEELARAIEAAEWRLADAEDHYESAQRPGMWKDMAGRRIGVATALQRVIGARQALAAINGTPYLAVPELTRSGDVRAWRVVECSTTPTTGTAVRIVRSMPSEQNAECEAYRLNRQAEHDRVLARMRADVEVIDAAWAERSEYADVPVSTHLWHTAKTAVETARRHMARAEAERGTGAAERCAGPAEAVTDARRTLESYATHRAEAAACHARRTAAALEAARSVRAVPDHRAAAGRTPQGTLPKTWDAALRDVEAGRIHTQGGIWHRVTRHVPAPHRTPRVLAGLLALGLIAEADDVTTCGTVWGHLIRPVTLTPAGAERIRAEVEVEAGEHPVAEAVPDPRPAEAPTGVEAPRNRYEGLTVADWRAVADAHALRATRAGRDAQKARQALYGPALRWTDTPRANVPTWARDAAPAVATLVRTALRRAAVAQEMWMRIGWESADAVEAGDVLAPRRAAELAGRGGILADACERAAAEARTLTTPPHTTPTAGRAERS
ncbi:hypothetical protein [Streptomyces sp. Isolate_45]|uniref:hypothetical protein n=1 Tax=Streptomyces sp. Isolate_45 TaxID=2950111 RepID=UPI002481EFEA|nr:hypothetical protein [Streptomyces sp. Isolate_45]MDA5284642.1 hypothetical protein [Streptomyces sp. Isolate_45]